MHQPKRAFFFGIFAIVVVVPVYPLPSTRWLAKTSKCNKILSNLDAPLESGP
jgi:hypothetical protein